ncbi:MULTISPECIES: DUF6737 family protein [Aphanothece]|uniref:DUF6737 family protein n=1 Tax=Aphanothece TaxID=1121 RepID=UPI003985474D
MLTKSETTPAQAGPSIWASKPWWCQPWSIVLTGMAVPTASWVTLHRWWITVPLAVGVLLWWWLFLLVVPAAYRRGELEPQEGPPA